MASGDGISTLDVDVSSTSNTKFTEGKCDVFLKILFSLTCIRVLGALVKVQNYFSISLYIFYYNVRKINDLIPLTVSFCGNDTRRV